jgi:hypothetical protein
VTTQGGCRDRVRLWVGQAWKIEDEIAREVEPEPRRFPPVVRRLVFSMKNKT